MSNGGDTEFDVRALRVALVHDELIRRGGAEVVFETIVGLFPTADVYSLYSGGSYMTVDGVKRDIQTSSLQRLPKWFRRHPGRLLPLLPQAAEQFDFADYDLVISSASGFAKGVVTRSNVPHLCYCHTPTRYLWDTTHEVLRNVPKISRVFLKPILHYLRLADYAAAQRVDGFIANSHFTQRRIQTYYGRRSGVIYPPIDTEFFTPQPGGTSAVSKYTSPDVRENSPFLLVGRLTPTKHFGDAVSVCNKLGYPLVVVGAGPHIHKLQKLAGSKTVFAGRVSNEKLRELYRSARAVLQPGVEDFGMAAAEALSCGTPVVAQNEGGVKEIVQHGKHGVLYSGKGQEALAQGIRSFLEIEESFSPLVLRAQVEQFSSDRFEKQLLDVLAKGYLASVG